MPKMNAIREFEGVFFVKKGPYSKAIIRFALLLPEKYPNTGFPRIRILSRLLHPLLSPTDKSFDYLNATGAKSQKPIRITDSLHLMVGCFDELFMYQLEPDQCLNREALSLLKEDRMAFDEIVAECISESIEFARSSKTGTIPLGSPLPSEGIRIA